VEVGNVESVMDGGLEPFIRAFLTGARAGDAGKAPDAAKGGENR
jgi:hypothetical protein